MLNQKKEEKFVEIIVEAIGNARRVDCSQEDYLEGLEIMRDDILSEITMITEEIENKGG